MSADEIGAAPDTAAGKRRLPVSLDLEAALRHEMRLLTEVAAGTGDFAVFIWSCQRCLVVPHSVAARPGFPVARAALNSVGWPIFARATGGDVTPQGPGIVNVSVAFIGSADRPDPIGAAYATLCGPLLDYLRDRGIEVSCGPVAGAMCNGRYNIVCSGRKLAGTAQRWRPAGAPGRRCGCFAVLGHASIYRDTDLAAAAEAVQSFLTASGAEKQIDVDRHINLTQLADVRDPTAFQTFHEDLERIYHDALAHGARPRSGSSR